MNCKKSESDFQSEVIKYLKSKNIYYVNVYGSGMSGKGTPDLLVCIKGRFVAMELKVGGNTMSSAQKIRANKILANGGIHCTPRTLEEVIKIIETVV